MQFNQTNNNKGDVNNAMFPPPAMLAHVPAVCLCGWRGTASEAVQRPSGLLSCPTCSRLVERQIPQTAPRPNEQRIVTVNCPCGWSGKDFQLVNGPLVSVLCPRCNRPTGIPVPVVAYMTKG